MIPEAVQAAARILGIGDEIALIIAVKGTLPGVSQCRVGVFTLNEAAARAALRDLRRQIEAAQRRRFDTHWGAVTHE